MINGSGSKRLLALLSHTKGGSISTETLFRIFHEKTRQIEALLQSCGCEGRSVNGKLYYLVSQHSRVVLGMKLCSLGVEISKVAEFLTWGDFEMFVARVAEACGYEVIHDFRLKNPRLQVDVICSKGEFGIAFDCKHWKRDSISALRPAARAQERRVARIKSSGKLPQIDLLVPALVGLHENTPRMVGRVPVVPVHTLNEFLTNAAYFAEDCELYRPDEWN
jgi:hypothetical protein